MDRKKLDPALALVLEQADNSFRWRQSTMGIIASPQFQNALTVYVHTYEVPNSTQVQVLEEVGIHGINSRRQTFTANLTPDAVERLSQLDWIKYIQLSSSAHPVAILR